MKDFKPNIVIFRCNWCSPAGGDGSQPQFKDDPPRIIKTNCTGRIDPTYVYQAFAKGADGVMIVGCAPGDCHYMTGNYKAGRNILLLRRVLSQFGIEPERLHAEWLNSCGTDGVQAAFNEFAGKIARLGPLSLN